MSISLLPCGGAPRRSFRTLKRPIQPWRSDEFVSDIVIGFDGFTAQKGQTYVNQVRAVLRGLVRNRTNQRTASLAHFLERFRNAILPHDGDVLFAFERTDS